MKVKRGLKYLFKNFGNNLLIFLLCLSISYGNEKKPDIIVKFGYVKNDFTGHKIQFQNLIDELKEHKIKETETDLFKI